MRIELGWRVKDRFNGLIGFVIARTEWLYGCVRITIAPETAKDGKPPDTFTIDEPQCIVLDRKNRHAAEEEPPHGDRPLPSRSPDPKNH